ncbi:MAG: Pr6Pr family membrane protein [Bifidobacteriaceae bacterium]|jgi:hypothetical protein|nr:Pr6Pr family membrane protein [Bifidobacteriaceae bacterium]
MRVKSLLLASVFRATLLGIGMYGVWLNISAFGGDILSILSYYTILSNILVIVFFAWLLFYTVVARQLDTPRPFYTVKGAVTVAITLTFLVFHFMLRPTMFTMGSADYVNSPANVLVHYVVPLMTIADWLLFDKKGNFKKLDPIKWLLIPLTYLVFALIRAQFIPIGTQSRYPYFFIDLDQLGVAQVALNVVSIAVGLVILGYVIYFIDYLMSRIRT